MKDDSMYMNIHTGSVATGIEWMKDFEEREEKSESFEEWDGGSLVEVKKINKEWVEV